MKHLILASAVVASLLPSVASAASNPIGGAVENFITIRPAEGVPDPRSYGGVNDCRTAPGEAWWGRFAGGSGDGGRNAGVRMQTSEGCFPNRNACLSWLRAMKSKFGFYPVYNQCRAGYEPGASVPAWWSPQSD
ncbi:hypothetical protein GCM10007276_12910 [Agaricicola taiwanensis]|uniref:Uncharacterized protein n=1 Tax=Agaricicola taiwanensis TaxID=591372 RepID=A0A8J2YEH3_9RHOB|nr:hypothetical protein [Agaricicola taiwanensis]GGE36873.1 hypothetical protein GCM10007276_12910 [Agaricicola taiwanensis]